MSTYNHLPDKTSWQVPNRITTKNPNKRKRKFVAVGFLGCVALAIMVYRPYNDMTTIDGNAHKIEVTTVINPTVSGMNAAREQLPEEVADVIDRSEMGRVISNEIYYETGEEPNKQGAHTLEVTVELDGDVEEATLIK